MHIAAIVLRVALGGAAMYVVSGQVRKPQWGIGRLFIAMMNVRHASVTKWGLSHVSVGKQFTILDIGCGGGRNIRGLAESASEGKVYGIDYSTSSVAAARSANAELIRAGRVDVRHGSVSHLPYPDAMFDLVTAVETHFYWPDLVSDFKEVLRVVKPGGQFVVIAEIYKDERGDPALGFIMKSLRARYLSVNEHRDLLTAAGFTEIEIFEERKKNWICAVARRSSVGTPVVDGSLAVYS